MGTFILRCSHKDEREKKNEWKQSSCLFTLFVVVPSVTVPSRGFTLPTSFFFFILFESLSLIPPECGIKSGMLELKLNVLTTYLFIFYFIQTVRTDSRACGIHLDAK